MSDRLVIIGGGVVGVSALYELTARGVPATLLEARENVALETSFANGAMLTPSMPDPWNSPGVWRHLLSSLFEPYAAMKLRLHAIPGLASWGVKFLYNSTPRRYRHATEAVYALASYSVKQLETLTDSFAPEYSLNKRGTLKVFESQESLQFACKIAAQMSAHGLRYTRMSAAQAVELEPTLKSIKSRLVGAIFYPDDRSGDARAFTEVLARKACEAGGEIRTNVTVRKILTRNGAVHAVDTDEGTIDAKRIVLCAGYLAPKLARQVGVRLPIAPVKGYSVTLNISGLSGGPSLPILDDAMHAAVVPLGNQIRTVGTAEFTGLDRTLSPERVENLIRLLRRLFPELADKIDYSTQQNWTNFRAMSADGLPLIGQTGPQGFYVNVGHGYLGWTMATGAAHLLCDLMEGATPAIDPAPYRPDR